MYYSIRVQAKLRHNLKRVTRGAWLIRLVPTRAAARAIPPTGRRERGGSEARRQRGAVDPPPGGSARYRPAAARAGAERGARGGRERGGALAGRGESGGEREGVTAS